jgi:hypothetical protein
MYPVINFSLIDSDDPRDAIAKSFIENLGYDSSWLRITPRVAGDNESCYQLTPEKNLEGLAYSALARIFSCREALTKEEAALLNFAQKLAKAESKTLRMFNHSSGKSEETTIDCEIKDNQAWLEALDNTTTKSENEFHASHKLDEEVSFYRKQDVDTAYVEAKRKNPNTPEKELDFVPVESNGFVTRVSFTKARTYYDIVCEGKTYQNVASHYIGGIGAVKEVLLEEDFSSCISLKPNEGLNLLKGNKIDFANFGAKAGETNL